MHTTIDGFTYGISNSYGPALYGGTKTNMGCYLQIYNSAPTLLELGYTEFIVLP